MAKEYRHPKFTRKAMTTKAFQQRDKAKGKNIAADALSSAAMSDIGLAHDAFSITVTGDIHNVAYVNDRDMHYKYSNHTLKPKHDEHISTELFKGVNEWLFFDPYVIPSLPSPQSRIKPIEL